MPKTAPILVTHRDYPDAPHNPRIIAARRADRSDWDRMSMTGTATNLRRLMSDGYVNVTFRVESHSAGVRLWTDAADYGIRYVLDVQDGRQ